MTNKAYHTKHRPVGFDTVQGQAAACKMLQKVLDKGTSQAFIFDGPSGTGKTTLARIAATYSGCMPMDINEVDAATNSGAEETRKLQDVMAYRPIGGGEMRAVIVDECHGLSQKAWDTLLKAVEEPNAHCLWFFCTTNISKVPATIKTRCTKISLKLLNDVDLAKVVRRVMKKEKLDVDEGVFDVIVREARGSARQALVNLASVGDFETSKEAAKALHVEQESDATRDFCQYLLKPGSWAKAMGIVERFGETPNYEGIRIVVCNYMGKVVKSAKSDDAAQNALHILEQFSKPYNTSEGAGPFMLSIGSVVFA
jgi:DNA polymerase III gamma/tau subunit